jgi:hypothetical protein
MSNVELETDDLQTYSKLKDVVATRTFAEKTRHKSTLQQVASIKDASERYKARIDSLDERKDSLGAEKQELEKKKDAVI